MLIQFGVCTNRNVIALLLVVRMHIHDDDDDDDTEKCNENGIELCLKQTIRLSIDIWTLIAILQKV